MKMRIVGKPVSAILTALKPFGEKWNHAKTPSQANDHASFMVGCAQRQQSILDHPLVTSAFLFIRRSEIADSRLRKLCKALSGAGLEGTNIFYRHDPLWLSLFAPPSYDGCRCAAIPMGLDSAAKHLVIAREWIETGIQPTLERLCVKRPAYEDGRLVRLSTKWIGKRNRLRKICNAK